MDWREYSKLFKETAGFRFPVDFQCNDSVCPRTQIFREDKSMSTALSRVFQCNKF